MSNIPFCERNTRLWVISLIVLSLAVLGYAVWSAAERGRIGFPRARGAQAQTGKPTFDPQKAGPPEIPSPANPNTPGASVAAFQVPAPIQGPVDTVTRATPMGGIQFIGGVQPSGSNTAAFPAGQGSAQSIQNGFNRAADIIRPCVVNINASYVQFQPPSAINAAELQFVQPADGVPDKIIGQQAFESVGSGVIIDPAGYVITNHHIIAGTNTIVVTRFNHVEGNLQAQVVAADASRDLALLKIQGTGPFPSASLADSNRVEVGDWVLAVGNPFGLEHTVTAGIISGKRSSLTISGVNYRGLLQTDAPINKGSSGGPLVNLEGNVIGINTAIYAPTGVFSGTGFAIPSNRVGGFISRALSASAEIQAAQLSTPVAAPLSFDAAWLGIGVIDMTPDLASKLSYPNEGGVYVSSLILDSPADEAEITRGDILMAADGQPISSGADLRRILSIAPIGRPFNVAVWRNGKIENLQLRLKPGLQAGPV